MVTPKRKRKTKMQKDNNQYDVTVTLGIQVVTRVEAPNKYTATIETCRKIDNEMSLEEFQAFVGDQDIIFNLDKFTAKPVKNKTPDKADKAA